MIFMTLSSVNIEIKVIYKFIANILSSDVSEY